MEESISIVMDRDPFWFLIAFIDIGSSFKNRIVVAAELCRVVHIDRLFANEATLSSGGSSVVLETLHIQQLLYW